MPDSEIVPTKIVTCKAGQRSRQWMMCTKRRKLSEYAGDRYTVKKRPRHVHALQCKGFGWKSLKAYSRVRGSALDADDGRRKEYRS